MANGGATKRLAVLIDGDNASFKIADGLFAEVASLGYAGIRRIYGDFSSPQAKGWDKARARHAIVPHQQFANVPGKNATDIALVIDAMDLLHAGGLDGFCIVSSDSDFTRLATRIREHGLKVFGFGTKNAAESFRQACWAFFETETLAPAESREAVLEPAAVPKPAKVQQAVAAKVTPIFAPIAEAERLILRAMGEAGIGQRWVALETIHACVRKLAPEFKAKAYGCSKFSVLVRKTTCLELSADEGQKKKLRIRPNSPGGATKAA